MVNNIHSIIFHYYSAYTHEVKICSDGVPPRLDKQIKFPRKSIATIIGTFKSVFTKTINQKFPEAKFQWQERFYDHIIRNNEELNRIRKYIINNPKNYCNEKFK
ncbi:MAG TPA: hypothetical protein DEH02_21650 [Bacteroidales bacterium]|nr:hypothetical protein [Bacteroidales bacterium]